MGNELNVSPDDMVNEANQFNDVNTLANGITSTVVNAIRGLGPFWGNDPVGRQFENVFVPTVSGVGDGITGVGASMKKTGDGLADSAKLFDTSNQINTELAPNPGRV